MTDTDRPTRKQRRRASKRARKAQEKLEAAATSAQPGEDSRPEYASKDFDAKDLRYYYEAQKTDGWQFDGDLMRTLPSTFAAIASGKKIEEGEIVDDPEATINSKTAAARILVQMHGQNIAAERQATTFNFNVKRHIEGRHSHAETPEADEETTKDEGQNVVDAVGFREAGTLEDGVQVIKELEALGLQHLLLGQTRDSSK